MPTPSRTFLGPLGLAAALAACATLSPGVSSDWTVVPGERAGAIRARMSFEELATRIGSSAVERRAIPIGEGETIDGAVVFPGTPDEAWVVWRGPREIESVRLVRPGGRWRTREGLRVGCSLAEVANANGRPFRFLGFGWDYGGRLSSWDGGALSRSFVPTFRPTREVPVEELREVSGDDEVPSDHPVLARMGVVVDSIEVLLSGPAGPET